MNDKPVDQRLLDDVELIAFVRQAEDGREACSELNVLLRDFASELLHRRLLAKGNGATNEVNGKE